MPKYMSRRALGNGETGLQALKEVESGKGHRRVKPSVAQHISNEVVHGIRVVEGGAGGGGVQGRERQRSPTGEAECGAT